MIAFASENPLIVMLDADAGEKYMRSVDSKELGDEGDPSWLVQVMHQELQ